MVDFGVQDGPSRHETAGWVLSLGRSSSITLKVGTRVLDPIACAVSTRETNLRTTIEGFRRHFPFVLSYNSS